ncbi:MAG TPA: response regulator [Verrucomicrobiae bacterium]|jgi:DNA-binding response OmpR family regulator|nr:response regulator [Verrucomicrobiae bacterium]
MSKLLVVDDEVEICDFLKAFFEEREFDVRTAHNGPEALQMIQAELPQVVLLDIHMPGMDGMNVLRQIKKDFPRTKVIMVTAIETREKIEEAMRLGADNYITKPLSLEYLEKDVQDKIELLTGNR